MFLEHIAIHDFKNIHRIDVDFATASDLPGHWTCIAGLNGAGKSAVLQAIAIVLLGDRLATELGGSWLARARRIADNEQSSADIRARVRMGQEVVELSLPLDENGVNQPHLQADERSYQRMREFWSARARGQLLLSYGAGRNLSEYRDTRHRDNTPDVRRQMTLFDPLTQVASVDVLLDQGERAKPVLAMLKRLLDVVLEDVALSVEESDVGLQFRRGEVDHFRPTGGGKEIGGSNYWWLAYAFTNSFLACRQCNGRSCKGDQFPLAPPSSHATYDKRDLVKSEPRLLAEPVEDEVDTWMRVAWRDDEHDDEGRVQTQTHLRSGSIEHARTTRSIEVFRLDRDDDLRQGHIRAIRDALRAMKDGDRDEVHRLACRYVPHGAAAYCVLQEADRSWLPTPKEELLVFLEHLLDKFRRTSALLQRFPTDRVNQRSVQQFLWAFAVLWKDPPPGTLTSKEIARWLDDNLKPLKPDIEDKLGKL